MGAMKNLQLALVEKLRLENNLTYPQAERAAIEFVEEHGLSGATSFVGFPAYVQSEHEEYQ